MSVDHLKQIELRVGEAVEKNINDILSEAIKLENPSIYDKPKNALKNNKTVTDEINHIVKNDIEDVIIKKDEINKNKDKNLKIGKSYKIMKAKEDNKSVSSNFTFYITV